MLSECETRLASFVNHRLSGQNEGSFFVYGLAVRVVRGGNQDDLRPGYCFPGVIFE